MKNIKLIILMGLPGSGKSTWAKEYLKNNKNTAILDLDKIIDKSWSKKMSLTDAIREGISGVRQINDTIVVDGLILTNKNVVEVICKVASYYHKVKVIIHRWEEDRETCVKNDGGRREVSSVATILNAKFEAIDKEYIINEINDDDITIVGTVSHTVQLKPDYIRCSRPSVYIDADEKIRSEKWSAGGAVGNCWDSTMYSVSAEEPVDFVALDKLLESICPSITYLHYKKITKKCIQTEESYERNYYGGGVTYLNYVCDLKALYEELKVLGYIK